MTPRQTPAPTAMRTKFYMPIKASDLNIDRELQRTYDPRLAAKIETDWDPSQIGTIVVSQRADGTFWICDGQHRHVVARRHEGDSYLLDCEVHTGLTRQEEAKKYLVLNRQRKLPRPFDNYRVAIAAGEPLETRIQNELTDVGLEVAHTPSANRIGAVETVRRIAGRDKLKSGLVRDTMQTIINAWGRNQDGYDGMIIEGVSRVIELNRTRLDYKRLVKILARRSPLLWKQQAVIHTIGGGGSESRANAVAAIVVNEYNKGLRLPEGKIRSLARRR